MEQFEQYRPMMFAIAYRMLGSVMEAEDILQEAFLRYQATRPETIQSHHAFLNTIVTRLCLDYLKSAQTQRETYIGPWLPEPVRTDSHPELAATNNDTISMAFMVLLESLTPTERAVFLLREVFDYDYAEIALIVDKSEAACRKVFSRARQHIDDNRPRFETAPDEHQAILTQFMHTIATGDLNALKTLLVDDVVLYADGGGKVIAARQPVVGNEVVAKFMMGLKKYAEKQQVPDEYFAEFLEVNGRPAIVLRNAQGIASTLFTADTAAGKIKTLRVVRNPDKLHHV